VNAEIRVLVVDDHPLVRQGLRAFLSSREGIAVVAEAADGLEAVRKAVSVRPDVILMDLVMPGMDGITAIGALRQAGSAAPVVVLTSSASEEHVLPAVRAGASGYLLKDADPSEVERAIRAAAAGQALVDPAVAARLLREVAAPSASPVTGIDDLTAREREVLMLLASGRTNRQIARSLGVAEKTVKTHVSHVLGKLGVADRTQAALAAVRAGLVEP
jgi:DNA-binding NarL/FixJ family response regulator